MAGSAQDSRAALRTPQDSRAALRILAGRLKGMPLAAPRFGAIHPMGARERLALFNMVAVAGCRVADLFAGTGALGLEALSRGAAEVVMVERAAAVAKVLRRNLAQAQERGGPELGEGKLLQMAVAELAERPEYQEYFQVILADPPYAEFGQGPEFFGELAKLGKLMPAGGTLVLSSPAREPAPEFPGLTQCATRTYAGARLTVYLRGESEGRS